MPDTFAVMLQRLQTDKQLEQSALDFSSHQLTEHQIDELIEVLPQHPYITKLVFGETLPVTVPPSALIFSAATSRDDESRPVNTKILSSRGSFTRGLFISGWDQCKPNSESWVSICLTRDTLFLSRKNVKIA